MSRRRPSHIPLRRPIYIGCEGASEAGYAAYLQDLARHAGLPVHLLIQELGPGAGDPLARIELALVRLKLLKKKRQAPEQRFALLDYDQVGLTPQRDTRALKLAADNGIHILWQDPCFEAVLLRHLPDRTGHRPPSTSAAQTAIQRDWPGYSKPMLRADLARRIDQDAVLRAAGVEPGLEALLRCIGLL